MRDYNRKTPVGYRLPQSVYKETIAVCGNYDHVKALYLDAIEGSSVAADGMPRGTEIGDPTLSRVLRAEKYKDRLDILEQALQVLPSEYQRDVFENCAHRKPFPETSRRSLGRYKQIYLYHVAKKLMLI